jgi:2-hydroxy-6-oxonona-2,4-dienedioate hydrolase
MIGELAAAWASTRRLEAAGTRVRYREAGEGPAVVLVHGLAVSADYWPRNGPAIAAAGYRVVAPDLPGFGRTTGGARTMSVPGQSAALGAIVEALGLGAAVFVGHSLSCQTVLELAARQPFRVRGLVLAAPTGERRRLVLTRQAIGLARDAFREPPSLLPLIGLAYLRAGPVRFYRTWRAGARHDTASALELVRAPGLVVLGSDDPVVSPHYAAEVADRLTDARLEMVEGAAHAVHFGRPREFNAAVVRFLEQLDTAEAVPGTPAVSGGE